ncbi:uncharacterized protein B4U79_16834 [Dinothrombium tinctorium]|uniref:SF3 helicase domain-containing protein n=1 Tax=Dinothrombium tinctorium TaxID=1965070 RepID=A0A3S3NDS9_9ACAR|nr:uncharacterized protein B4U79_16834 [Dinothrombium tinctorium]
MDPFVMGHWNMWRFLEAVHSEAASKNYTPKHLPAYTNPGYDGWPAAVLAWWNGWSLDGWHHKKPQLFLCGPPNTGKSTFIMKLVHGLKVFYPCSGSFAFTGLDDTYDLILIEEYKKDDFPRNVLIRLLEGLEISFNQKYLPAKKLCWRKPICLVTNGSHHDEEDATLARVQITRPFQWCIDSIKTSDWVASFNFTDILSAMGDDNYLKGLKTMYRDYRIKKCTLVPVVTNFMVEEWQLVGGEAIPSRQVHDWVVIPFDDSCIKYKFVWDKEYDLKDQDHNHWDVFNYAKAYPKGVGHVLSTRNLKGPFINEFLPDTVSDAPNFLYSKGFYRRQTADSSGYMRRQTLTFTIHILVAGGQVPMTCKESYKVSIQGYFKFYMHIQFRNPVFNSMRKGTGDLFYSKTGPPSVTSILPSKPAARTRRDVGHDIPPSEELAHMFSEQTIEDDVGNGTDNMDTENTTSEDEEAATTSVILNKLLYNKQNMM